MVVVAKLKVAVYRETRQGQVGVAAAAGQLSPVAPVVPLSFDAVHGGNSTGAGGLVYNPAPWRLRVQP
jgi:hypothetical protein